MTPNQLKRLFPNASISTIKANLDKNSELRTTKQEQPSRKSLECSSQGKDTSGVRFEICFRIYSTRPLDWDNYWIKSCQDLLIESGILHGDAWNVLQGRVISEKAHSKKEERMIIEINYL